MTATIIHLSPAPLSFAVSGGRLSIPTGDVAGAKSGGATNVSVERVGSVPSMICRKSPEAANQSYQRPLPALTPAGSVVSPAAFPAGFHPVGQSFDMWTVQKEYLP